MFFNTIPSLTTFAFDGFPLLISYVPRNFLWVGVGGKFSLNSGPHAEITIKSYVNVDIKIHVESLQLLGVSGVTKAKNFASADRGPHSRVCARKTLCSAPHQH